MFNFKYYTPTKVVFGKETELQVAELIREFGGKKVLIHNAVHLLLEVIMVVDDAQMGVPRPRLDDFLV